MERNYKFDNIKLILIFLVIVGHFFELFKGEERVYLTIYTFHMPIFIVLTGLFAKENKKRLFSYLFTYLIFQVLYKLFDFYVLKNGNELSITFMTPYWLLWYILVVIFYNFIIPLINVKNNVLRLTILIISVALSLLIPFNKDVGYYLSMSRFFTFLPYFILGFYLKDYINNIDTLLSKKKVYYPLLSAFSIIVIGICIFMIKDKTITQNMLYGSYSYESAKYNIGYKTMFIGFALSFMILFYLLIPNKKIPFVSILGSNTMMIFLFHGFIVRYLKYIKFFDYTLTNNILLSCLFALIIIIIFGNKYVSRFLSFIFTGKFIFVIFDKIFKKKEAK